MSVVVACKHCGTKNRVDQVSAAVKLAKCGKCGTPLELPSPGSDDGTPIIVNDISFAEEVLNVSSTVLLDCWAPWCGPCRMVGPIMDQLAAESNGKYRIAKLNVDENPQTAAQFQIQSIPTMLIFKDGKLVDRLIGAQPKAAILARLQSHVNWG